MCPHAGGVGLCEYVIHLRYEYFLVLHFQGDLRRLGISLIDYIAVSGTMERNVLEFVDHLHEHFVTPCSINSRGRYNVPTNPDEGYRYFRSFLFLVSSLTGAYSSIEMHKSSIAEYQWPNGTYWQGRRAEIAPVS